MHTNPEQTFPQILWGIIRRPRETFATQREQGSPAWRWMAGILLILALSTIWVSAPISRKLARQAMQQQMESIREQNPQMTPEQEAQMLKFADNPLFTVVIPSIRTFFGLIIGWFAWSGALHLLSTMMGGGESFGQMWRAVIWSQVPLALRNLLQSVYILATGTLIANPGLSGLVAPQANVEQAVQDFLAAPPSVGQIVLRTLLGKIDLFTLWYLVLLAIAVTVTARLSTRKGILSTALVVVLLTALSLAPVLISTSMSGAFGGGQG